MHVLDTDLTPRKSRFEMVDRLAVLIVFVVVLARDCLSHRRCVEKTCSSLVPRAPPLIVHTKEVVIASIERQETGYSSVILEEIAFGRVPLPVYPTWTPGPISSEGSFKNGSQNKGYG